MNASAKQAKSVAIVWLRRDLRLADNPALYAACRDHDAVIAVFCHDPSAEHIGAASKVRLHHSLKVLAQHIDNTNISLIFSDQSPHLALPPLMRAVQAQGLYWNRLYAPDQIAEEAEVLAAARQLPCHRFKGHLLTEPEEHHKADGTPYRVFTPFWKAMQPKLDPCPLPLPVADCKTNAKMPAQLGVSLEQLKLLPAHRWGADLATEFRAGEQSAHDLLDDFVTHLLAGYESGRDMVGNSGTSGLSAALHFGELSPRQILHRLAGAPGATSFIRQLAWRDFAHHLLYHFPHTADAPLNPKYNSFPWLDGEKADGLFAAWAKGETGISLVDAGMKQLWHTGIMHNRVRMVAASFLIKNMLIDWRRGRDWFHDTLIDADQANNVMGWQWVAGCGADAAPFFRVFNPELQAAKFDPDGTYRTRWLGPDWQNRPSKPVIDLKSSRLRALDAYKQIK